MFIAEHWNGTLQFQLQFVPVDVVDLLSTFIGASAASPVLARSMPTLFVCNRPTCMYVIDRPVALRRNMLSTCCSCARPTNALHSPSIEIGGGAVHTYTSGWGGTSICSWMDTGLALLLGRAQRATYWRGQCQLCLYVCHRPTDRPVALRMRRNMLSTCCSCARPTNALHSPSNERIDRIGQIRSRGGAVPIHQIGIGLVFQWQPLKRNSINAVDWLSYRERNK